MPVQIPTQGILGAYVPEIFIGMFIHTCLVGIYNVECYISLPTSF